MKKAIGSCLAAFLLLGAAAPLGALADTPYKTYTYDYSWEPVETPHAYTVGRVLTGAGLGVEDFLNPSDVFVDGNQNVYVADTGNNRICVFDAAFGRGRILAGFTREDGTEDAFKSPSGVYVNEAGEIYVADTDNARIVRLRADGSLVRVYDAPEISLLAEDYVYMPTTLVVDKAERMYVVARNVNMGVIQLSREGLFDGFVGAAKVSYNPLDYLWRTFMTEEQVSRTAAFVPTEYNNIAIDASDFLYVTSSAIEYADLYGYITNPVAAPRIAPVKRLNPSGNDVLKRTTNLPVAGDVLFDPGNQQDTSVFSSIIDVAIGQEGTYTILDASHNRYFTYYRTGELLYAFGVRGNQDGTTTGRCPSPTRAAIFWPWTAPPASSPSTAARPTAISSWRRCIFTTTSGMTTRWRSGSRCCRKTPTSTSPISTSARPCCGRSGIRSHGLFQAGRGRGQLFQGLP